MTSFAADQPFQYNRLSAMTVLGQPQLLTGGARLWRGCAETSRSSVMGRTSQTVESPGGLAPPGAPRSVREPLDSYGSRCSAVSMTELPVGEECWIYAA